MSAADLTPRRVIIRTHSDMLQEVDQITNAWFHLCGFCEENEVYPWHQRGHFMRVGWESGGRLHIIIDISKDLIQNPDTRQIPHEIWKAVKNANQGSYVRIKRFPIDNS